MELTHCVKTTTRIFCFAILGAIAIPATAAVLRVPDDFSSIYAAVGAASTSGDEIRVRNNYVETGAWIDGTGKSFSITSYSPDFSTPEAGAVWDSLVAGSVDDALLTVGSGTVSVTGMRIIRAEQGNAFFLTSDANLNLDDCLLSGSATGNTAEIKTGTGAQNVSVNMNATTVTETGRGIWFNSIGGNSSLTITNSAFLATSSFPIEWRTIAGDHHFEMSDTTMTITNNRQVRLLTFNTAAGTLVSNNVNIERCSFTSLPTGRSPLKVGGVPDIADANSTMTIKVSNCLFDLIDGLDSVETVALDTQDDVTDRRFSADFDQCTIVFNGTDKCGFRLRENQSTINVSNSIVDGNGEGRAALRGWHGTIISHKNLLYATSLTESAVGGFVILSGNEITDVSAEFADRDHRDFQLSETSPCLNAGDELGYVTDILGNPRPNPFGSNPDLGAYELGVLSSVADWTLY